MSHYDKQREEWDKQVRRENLNARLRTVHSSHYDADIVFAEALERIERLEAALGKIVDGSMEEWDESEQANVRVWMDADEMQDIARAALERKRDE